MGNTNFSIMLPRLLFTRRHGAELVARAVGKYLGVEGCGVNDRNDIIVRSLDKEYKVSDVHTLFPTNGMRGLS